MLIKDDLETFFSDVVKLEANPETIAFTFGIRSGDNETAKASHKVIMTVPHFLRLADVCSKAAKDVRTQIEKEKKNKE